MAYSNQLRNVTLKAAASLATRQFHIVELAANVLECDLAIAGRGYGVVQNHPASGEAATVSVEGETRVRAGGAVSVGAYITSAATGYATSIASGGAGGIAIGRAKTSAASGSIFTMELMRMSVASGSAL